MAEHDPLDHELRALAAEAEQRTMTPMAASDVRRLGTQRRHRRLTAIAVTAAVVIGLSGGAVFSAVTIGTQEPPSPAQTPGLISTPTPTPSASPSTTPSPTPTTTTKPSKSPTQPRQPSASTNRPATTEPAPTKEPRTITAENLLQPSDVPTDTTEQQVVTTDPALGRSVAESSVCLTDGLNALGATKILSRNFRIVVPDEPSSTADPGNELAGQPSIYTQALQFSTEAMAEEAVEAYRDWIAECSALLESRGYTVLGELNRTWYPVNVDTEGATGQFAELTYRAPGQSEDFGWWEAIGLTQRGDRLMITVSLTVGQDKNVAYEQYPADPDLMALHEQYALIIAAAERLGA